MEFQIPLRKQGKEACPGAISRILTFKYKSWGKPFRRKGAVWRYSDVVLGMVIGPPLLEIPCTVEPEHILSEKFVATL